MVATVPIFWRQHGMMYDIAQYIYFKYERNEDKETESQISLETYYTHHYRTKWEEGKSWKNDFWENP